MIDFQISFSDIQSKQRINVVDKSSDGETHVSLYIVQLTDKIPTCIT